MVINLGDLVKKPKRYARPESRAIWLLPKSIEAIAKHSETNIDLLKKVAARKIDPYIDFKLRKRTGGTRTIAAPLREFRPALNYLLAQLSTDYVHDAAFAYVPGKSAADAARMHEGMYWGVKLDLKDFFGSIDEDKIYVALTAAGLSPDRARLIRTLTTRSPANSKDSSKTRIKRPFSFLRTQKKRGEFRRVGYLPQGSPTSGFLANIAAWDLDCALSQMACEEGLVYTRYSDDILLSAMGVPFNREVALKTIASIRKIVNSYGFELNNKKTRILTPGSRKQYLGLLLDAPGLRLTKEKRQAIETTMWALEKYGTYAHARHLGYTSNLEGQAGRLDIGQQLLNKLWGQIAYVLDVEPTLARKILYRIVLLGMTDDFFSDPDGGLGTVEAAKRLLGLK